MNEPYVELLPDDANAASTTRRFYIAGHTDTPPSHRINKKKLSKQTDYVIIRYCEKCNFVRKWKKADLHIRIVAIDVVLISFLRKLVSEL